MVSARPGSAKDQIPAAVSQAVSQLLATMLSAGTLTLVSLALPAPSTEMAREGASPCRLPRAGLPLCLQRTFLGQSISISACPLPQRPAPIIDYSRFALLARENSDSALS